MGMMVKLTDIHPHPMNKEIYTISDIDDLVDSIRSKGLLEPIVIDQNFHVISGHRRLTAIAKLEWEDVEVIQKTLDDDDVLSTLVHYNKHRIKTCREQINEVKILMDQHKVGQGKRNDLTTCENVYTGSKSRDVVGKLVGISGVQVSKLLFIERESEQTVDLIDQGIMTINQAYKQTSRDKKVRESRSSDQDKTTPAELTNSTFYKKCSSNMEEIKDQQVDLIFTSPPYWNKRKYTESDGLGNERDPNEYVTNLVKHLRDCKRILNDRGSFYLNLGDTFHNGNLLNLPHRVAIGLQDCGWIQRNTIIWAKTNPKPSSTKTNLTQTYEFIYHFVKTNDYKYELVLGDMKKGTKSSHSPRHRVVGDGKIAPNPYVPRDGKNLGDYWTEDTVRSAVARQKPNALIEHPATFPEDIITLPILSTTREGDLVCDPFMGSGTVRDVSLRYNRSFVGYDVHQY